MKYVNGKINIRKFTRFFRNVRSVIILSVFIGLVIGLFGSVLLKMEDIGKIHFNMLIFFLPVSGVLTIFLYKRYDSKNQKGMENILKSFQKGDKLSVALVPLIMFTTWISHLTGASVGREGVAVQIGGVLGENFSKTFQTSKQILMLAGMAAGFGALFQTPFTAAFFALEINLINEGSLKVLPKYGIYTLIGSFTGYAVANLLGLQGFHKELNLTLAWNLKELIALVFLGVILGIISRLFVYALSTSKYYLSKYLKNEYIRVVVVSIFLVGFFILLGNGRYTGLGLNLINDSFNGNVLSYDWLLKLILTVLSVAAGFQGGEVTPLFAIGASAGVIIAKATGLPCELGAIVGYVTVFGGASGTILAPILLAVEIFGGSVMPVVILPITIGYAVSGKKSMYGQDVKILR